MTERARPQVIRPGEGERLPFGRLIATEAFEALELSGPGQGPPPHVHRHHDELFYVLEGRVGFLLEEEAVDAPAGTVVLVPRGTRHGFSRPPGARLLAVTVPAGLAGFFRELGAAVAEGRPSAETRAALAGRYDSHPG